VSACSERLVKLAGCCRSRKAVRSSSSSGMTPRRGSQRASFGLHARGNEECRADTIGLVPVGRPKSLVDMLLSPALPEPPRSGDARHRSLCVTEASHNLCYLDIDGPRSPFVRQQSLARPLDEASAVFEVGEEGVRVT